MKIFHQSLTAIVLLSLGVSGTSWAECNLNNLETGAQLVSKFKGTGGLNCGNLNAVEVDQANLVVNNSGNALDWGFKDSIVDVDYAIASSSDGWICNYTYFSLPDTPDPSNPTPYKNLTSTKNSIKDVLFCADGSPNKWVEQQEVNGPVTNDENCQYSFSDDNGAFLAGVAFGVDQDGGLAVCAAAEQTACRNECPNQNTNQVCTANATDPKYDNLDPACQPCALSEIGETPYCWELESHVCRTPGGCDGQPENTSKRTTTVESYTFNVRRVIGSCGYSFGWGGGQYYSGC